MQPEAALDRAFGEGRASGQMSEREKVAKYIRRLARLGKPEVAQVLEDVATGIERAKHHEQR